MSGKGGVGKSTTSANIARKLADKYERVGVLDLDLTGPSMPTIFGVKGQDIKNKNSKIIPVVSGKIEIVSIGLMLTDPNDAIIWRGPKKNGMIKSFFELIEWKSDIIVIDLPPGTSDEHLATFDILKSKGLRYDVIIVTTPSLLSVADVKKGINLCKKMESNILGVVENMSGVLCPCCNKVSQLLGSNAAEEMASELNLKILTKIPFLPLAASAADKGESCDALLQFLNPVVDVIVSE